MDDLYELDGTYDDEDDTYEHHDHSTVIGTLRCYRKARITCRVILHVLQRNRIPAVRVILVATKQKYKDLVRMISSNTIYRDMLRFVRQIIVMYNNLNFDGMKEVLEWKIGEYDRRMGPLNIRVNNYVRNNAFNDITRTTNNATNIGHK